MTDQLFEKEMKDMKTFKTTTPKALIAGFMLAGLLMTGCSANNGDNAGNNTPAPSATATASATETAAPSATATPQPTSSGVSFDELTKEEREEADKKREAVSANPLGVADVQVMLSKADPQIASNFSLSKEQVDSAVLQTLNTYKELYSIKNFQGARQNDPADSTYIGSQFSDKIAASYLPTLKGQMDKQAPFPTVNRDGTIGTINGVVYRPKVTAPGETLWVTSFSDEPAITYTEIKGAEKGTGPSHGINVRGERRDLILVEGGGAVESKCEFSVTSVPAADNKWLIAGIGCINQKITVLTQADLDKRLAELAEAKEEADAKN